MEKIAIARETACYQAQCSPLDQIHQPPRPFEIPNTSHPYHALIFMVPLNTDSRIHKDFLESARGLSHAPSHLATRLPALTGNILTQFAGSARQPGYFYVLESGTIFCPLLVLPCIPPRCLSFLWVTVLASSVLSLTFSVLHSPRCSLSLSLSLALSFIYIYIPSCSASPFSQSLLILLLLTGSCVGRGGGRRGAADVAGSSIVLLMMMDGGTEWEGARCREVKQIQIRGSRRWGVEMSVV